MANARGYEAYPYPIETGALDLAGSAVVPGPLLGFVRAHSGAPATDPVLNTDRVGELRCLGYDGSGGFVAAGSLVGVATADWTAAARPMRWVLDVGGQSVVTAGVDGLVVPSSVRLGAAVGPPAAG